LSGLPPGALSAKEYIPNSSGVYTFCFAGFCELLSQEVVNADDTPTVLAPMRAAFVRKSLLFIFIINSVLNKKREV
jgi:hypothetical protein